MLAPSSNALLKTFEEPAASTYILLLTSDIDALLPTIVSRCRKIPFFPIPQEEIGIFAQKEWKKTPEEASRIALLSQGSLSKAKLLSEGDKEGLSTLLCTTLHNAVAADYPLLAKSLAQLDALLLSEETPESEGTSQVKRLDLVLESIFGWYRDLHLLKSGADPRYLYHSAHLSLLQQSLQSAAPPPLEKIAERLDFCRLALQRNVKLKNVLEHFFCSVGSNLAM
jgi:DNA polymerase-3 subunit delta'